MLDANNENLQTKAFVRVGKEGCDRGSDRGTVSCDLVVHDVTFIKGDKPKPRQPPRKLTPSEIEQARSDLERVIKNKDVHVEVPDPRLLKREIKEE